MDADVDQNSTPMYNPVHVEWRNGHMVGHLAAVLVRSIAERMVDDVSLRGKGDRAVLHSDLCRVGRDFLEVAIPEYGRMTLPVTKLTDQDRNPAKL